MSVGCDEEADVLYVQFRYDEARRELEKVPPQSSRYGKKAS